jgi:lysophospholipase L1-like esterase
MWELLKVCGGCTPHPSQLREEWGTRNFEVRIESERVFLRRATEMKHLLRMIVAAGMGVVATVGLGQTAPAAAASAPAQAPVSVEKQLATAQAKLMDWAQLNRFKEKDAAMAAPAAGEQRVVFFGDSITEGWGRPGNSFFPGKPYVNRGISGQTSAQMVVRFHQDVVNLHPAVVVILAGTNDVAENTGPMTEEMTLDDFRAMAEMARANGIKVVVCAIPPAADFPWRPGLGPAAKIRSLNARLETWSKAEGIVWVDYYTPLADDNGGMKPGLSLDGVHPTAAGYAIMAPLAEAGIKETLRRK